ncbi:MAG: PorT family protein [Chitinophagaceae bacterium]|nr:PorT family protein [Chitinophagaceae bacterium]
MQRLILIGLLLFPAILNAQFGIGVKAGVNFANIKDEAGFNSDSRTGFMVGAYFAPGAKKFLSFRSEIILSRQGYNYKTATNTGNVNLDYLLLPQLFVLKFSKLVQVHAGVQGAFLLNANVDSTGSGSGSLFDYFKRFDYGVVGGAEIFPFMGLFIGARINVSLNNANEEAPLGGSWPNFIPRVDAKNNVVQIYTGWRF